MSMPMFEDCFAEPGKGNIIDGVHPITGRSIINGETLEQIRLRYPDAVLMAWEDWRTQQAAKQDTPIRWEPSTAEQYNDMLEVLPPAGWIGGMFLVGEPCDHSFSTGAPRYQAYNGTRGGEYFVSSRPITVAEFRIEARR